MFVKKKRQLPKILQQNLYLPNTLSTFFSLKQIGVWIRPVNFTNIFKSPLKNNWPQ